MTEFCEYEGRIYGIILRDNTYVDTVKFFTPDEFPLQVGIQCHRSGYGESAHRHKKIPRTINTIQQVIHVLKGRIRFEFFSPKGEKHGQIEIGPGDTILLTEHGHKMVVLEDIRTLTVKQGPYLGEEKDKISISEESL